MFRSSISAAWVCVCERATTAAAFQRFHAPGRHGTRSISEPESPEPAAIPIQEHTDFMRPFDF